MNDPELARRWEAWSASWRVAVERLVETDGSVLAFGRRDDRPVVLKVVTRGGSEWRAGAILEAFGGHGVVRVLEHSGGAMLLERLDPGTPLSRLVHDGSEDEATAILVQVIRTLSPRLPEYGVATVLERGRSFERCVELRCMPMPYDLIEAGRETYQALCASQTRERLLHGDLHHDNVLFDDERGWVAIDPKGVLGELEYEVGAALRNPVERPDVFADPAILRRRIERFTADLGLDRERVVAWAFAQSVLAAIWVAEDGTLEADHGWIALARVLRPMLGNPRP